MKTTIAALMMLMLVLPAEAQQRQAAAQAAPAFPEWNIRTHCERQQRVLNMESASLLLACIRQEEGAADAVRQDWAEAPAAVRRHCLRQQQVLRISSYALLNACFDQEAAALRELERR